MARSKLWILRPLRAPVGVLRHSCSIVRHAELESRAVMLRKSDKELIGYRNWISGRRVYLSLFFDAAAFLFHSSFLWRLEAFCKSCSHKSSDAIHWRPLRTYLAALW
jgi:hypothetical protein